MEKEIYYNEVMEKWLEEYGRLLAPSSYAKYDQLFSTHIRPFFENVRVRDLSREMVEEYRESLEGARASRRGRELSASTVKCILMLVNRGLAEAGRICGTDKPLRLTAQRKRSKREVQIFTEEEQKRLEAYLNSRTDISRTCVCLCLYTGLRIGELCGLTWEDVDLEEGCIRVKKTLQRLKKRQPDEQRTCLVVGRPKSLSSDRIVPFPDFMREKLEAFRKTGERSGYILTGSSEAPLDPRTLQYRYKRYLRDAQIPYRKFHALRHTFASRCLMAGIDAKTLSEILGHADIQTTLNIYCHTTLQYKKEQINRLQPFFS